jgi:hypothetical protein
MSEQLENIKETAKPTTIGDRENPGVPSHFFQISVRGWLAVGLIITVCMKSLAEVVLAIMLKDVSMLKVTEPLYTMAGMALAYYFGQKSIK